MNMKIFQKEKQFLAFLGYQESKAPHNVKKFLIEEPCEIRNLPIFSLMKEMMPVAFDK